MKKVIHRRRLPSGSTSPRVTLSRLLEEAKAEGMIKFEIVDVRGAMKTLQLEEKLRQRFGLQDIKLVDCSGADTDTLTRKIGSEAASYFEQLVHNDMKIGLTWGRTLNSMIENLPPDKNIRDIHVYTLVGGSSQSVDFQPNILAQHLIDKYNGHATILTAPFMVSEQRTLLCHQRRTNDRFYIKSITQSGCHSGRYRRGACPGCRSSVRLSI